jgi:hypothetical protein
MGLVLCFLGALLLWYSYFLWSTRESNYLKSMRKKLLPLHPIVEKLKFVESNEAYTINKRTVYLCTKDKTGKPYPTNMLIYAAIHEIAHSIDPEYREGGPIEQHPEPYMKIFKELLAKAEQLKIYDPKQPIDPLYCTA